MATALAAQLQSLRTAVDVESGSSKYKARPSILFDSREAADVDTVTLHSLALSGLEELVGANPIFAHFKKTLFSIESCHMDRELQSQEFNDSLNESIHNFLYMVSDFAILGAAHQTLEYLIRRFKIHIYNADDLIKFMLPYHETSLFVRIVQLTNIEKTRWKFLEGVRKSGAAPRRDLLVQQCLVDTAVLEGILESGLTFKIGGRALRSRTTYSFTVSVIIEVLRAGKTVDSSLVNKVVTFAVQSFDKGSCKDSAIGGLMIIGTLVDVAKMSHEALELLFNIFTRALGSNIDLEGDNVLLEMALMVVIQIIQTQCVKDIPAKVVRAVARIRDLPRILCKVRDSFNSNSAVTFLSNQIIRHCFANHHYSEVLQQIVSSVPTEGIADSIALNLLNLIMDCLKLTDDLDKNKNAQALVRLLETVKESFPEKTDFVINKFLESYGGPKDDVSMVLNKIFKETLNFILPESNQTICKSLCHPKADVRSLALLEAAKIAAYSPQMKLVCAEALLQGLADEELSVVQSVLSIEGLENLVDKEEILASLISVIKRCVLMLENGPSSAKSKALAAVTHCLKFLVSVHVNVHTVHTQTVGFILLSNMLFSQKCWKLNIAVIKLAKSLDWKLFKGLSVIEDESLKLEESSHKKLRNRQLFELNLSVIDALASSFSENMESLATDIISCAAKFERSKPLIVLVLLQSLTRACVGMHQEALDNYFGFLRQEWAAMEINKDFSALEEGVVWDNIFTIEFFKKMQRNINRAYASLLVACFYNALKCLPTVKKDSKKACNLTVKGLLENMFEVFSSPRSKVVFEKHTRLLLKKLPVSTVGFLSSFFNAEGGTVPLTAQLNSLNVLLCSWNESTNLQKTDIQSAVPHLIVALGSPIKAIRKSSFECLRKLQQMWRERTIVTNGSQIQSEFLDAEIFETFLEELMEYRDSFVSSGDFVHAFITSLLGFQDGHDQKAAAGVGLRLPLKKPMQLSIYRFLMKSAFTMPLHAQVTLICALKGAVSMKEQALDTKYLFESLLGRWKLWKLNGLSDELTKDEVQLFRHLLQVHLNFEGIFSVAKEPVNDGSVWFKTMMEILDIEKSPILDNDAIETLNIALFCLEQRLLKKLEPTCQDAVFERLIEFAWSRIEGMRLVSRRVLQNLKVNAKIICRYINRVLEVLVNLEEAESMQRELAIRAGRSLTAVFEFLLSEVDMENMSVLIHPLFESLRQSRVLYEIVENLKGKTLDSENLEHTESIHVNLIQQLVLEVLEKIVSSVSSGPEKGLLEEQFEVESLVEFIKKVSDSTTLNEALSLLATFGREYPDLVLGHVISVFSVIGETTMIHDDPHSFVVTERLLAAVIPSWLKKTDKPKLLLEIFVKALFDIPSHRRIPLLKTTLGLMQESRSLHVLLMLLLERNLSEFEHCRKLQKRKKNESTELDSVNHIEDFCSELCEQYEIMTCAAALLSLLRESQSAISMDSWKLVESIVLFIANQLRSSYFLTMMDNLDRKDTLKVVLIDMLEETLSVLQKLSISPWEKRKSLLKTKENVQKGAGRLMESITNLLSPACFAEAVVKLLKSRDENIRVRALYLVAEKMKCPGLRKNVQMEGDSSLQNLGAYENLTGAIADVLNDRQQGAEILLPALSALHGCSEQLAERLPTMYIAVLDNLFFLLAQAPSECLKCIYSIVMHCGLNVLPKLNGLIKGILGTGSWLQSLHEDESLSIDSRKKAVIYLEILNVLEAVATSMGRSLSPYIREILEFILLDACFIMLTDTRLDERTKSVRRVLTQTIPVELLLDPLIKVYALSLEKGESAVLACISMFSNIVASLDKPSVLAHYKTIFQLCLHSFDLRRQHPHSLPCVTSTETGIISLFCALVLKLSESTFKPMFVQVLEWAEAEVTDEEDVNGKSISRCIVFYRVVNQLAETLRSVFVPYYQYFLKRCVQQLLDGQDIEAVKPKKLKISGEILRKKPQSLTISSYVWHLRYLIICSLHKCFLYDNVGFLDAEKFQMLLGPLVKQISIQRPVIENESEMIPSTVDMDNALISCLGRMAITAGSDLLWKPLNHEVLLCTRMDEVRVKLISLSVIKTMVDNLKEDYLALLPETIPFLGELLEDSDLSVVSKSQEIIRLLEELSGESLSQYL
ncbi:hypothetical protein KP509_35G057300 [Ceratopteris richardii]|uniref:BP28 C-terminal domain-containing protein n=1 Tax=Ceratopteris richardii TaxID=49495 RepID=A0A8T2QHC3_CERRI|nr:hypothetical protein KP509_35G057300 [Ceratopteris richardii]